jgi:Flp pilus assembly pilin Flp
MQNLKNERGQGRVEYVLVVVLMGLLAIGSLKFLGQKTHNAFKTAGDAIDAQTTYGDGTGQTPGRIGD